MNLTPETLDLIEHERVIEQGLAGFVEVGTALLAIRDGKKYRHGGYATFEDYCQRRWNMSDRHGRRLMDAASVAGELQSGPIGPVSESQVRPLRGVEPEQRAEVWAEAVQLAGGSQPTARQVEEVVAARSTPAAPVELACDIDDVPEVLDAIDDDSWDMIDGGDFEPEPVDEPAPKIITGTDGKQYTIPPRPAPAAVTPIDKAEADRQDRLKRRASRLVDFLNGWIEFENFSTLAERDDVLALLIPHDREQLLSIERSLGWTTAA